ncbi:MFS transporter [Oryzifoliimicrobium ureilyticus]|uniref:MFS transporter n=1 Tax=Oryzifoliimicrobium ureilyticus TaxID=3113724 RepID=UPI003F66F795
MLRCKDGYGIETNAGRRQERGLTTGTALALALTAGLSVANVYFAQPLLDQMAAAFSIPPAHAGLVVTLTQIGYGLGLIFLVPLGDLVDRRKLVIALTSLSAAALLVVAKANAKTVLMVAMAIVGLLAVNAQVAVAFAATQASSHERGKALGIVTSGVVIGILAARSIAGVLTDLGSWRTVYLTSAAVMVVITVLLGCVIPSLTPTAPNEGYLSSLRSMPILFLRDRVLLLRGILALLIFATFSAFWTTLVLPLSAAPFSYSHTEIGLFGLVGLAGAVAATFAGKLADRGHAQSTTGYSLVLLVLSWELIALLPQSIPTLLIGILLLDLSVQAVHVTNQSIILTRHPEASSRLVGGYMVFYSVGSAAGATTSTIAYSEAGWLGVSALGAAYSAAGLLVWILSLKFSVLHDGDIAFHGEPERRP